MAEQYPYGVVKRFRFKLTKNGSQVTGVSLSAADVQVSLDDGVFQNVGTQCGEIGEGWYYWEPSAASYLQSESIVINIRDYSSSPIGTLFDENGGQLKTGGNVNAFYDGT